MRLLAHRGYHLHHPENTMAAFEAALAVGFDGIETDVRLSADQQCVLLHDRVLKNGLPVAAMSRRELSELCGYPVPTLREALDAFPACYWNIEIKTPAAASLALPILQQYERSHHVLLTSFRHDVVLAAAELVHVECGLLNAHRPAAINSLLHATLAFPRLRTLVWDCEIVDPDVLQQANALGFRNVVYNAKTRYEHELMAEYGCHAIISDFPEHLDLLG